MLDWSVSQMPENPRCYLSCQPQNLKLQIIHLPRWCPTSESSVIVTTDHLCWRIFRGLLKVLHRVEAYGIGSYGISSVRRSCCLGCPQIRPVALQKNTGFYSRS